MKHIYVEIQNFKGIKSVRLDFDGQPRSNIYTLVGLNESGKTTILEALNFLGYNSETLNPLDLPGYSIKNVQDLIPIGEKANFNKSIQINAGYRLEAAETLALEEFLWDRLKFRLKTKIPALHIKQSYRFRDSKLQEGQPVIMTFFGEGGPTQGRRLLSEQDDQIVFEFIKEQLLPSVLYFPNFLFEFPERIYLEDVFTDSGKHRFYTAILQDVLDSIGEQMGIEQHILARAKEGTPDAEEALNAVLAKMSHHISSTVFENWDSIFKRPPGNKRIALEAKKDEDGKWYLRLSIKQGGERYSISQGSLGFRWFFAFLLLTQYRGSRRETKNVLFLFDEPASNLHSAAQTRLLETFGKFPETCSIVYTTHTHYMINPAWLEGTYVVKNGAMDYRLENDFARRTVITLEKYRIFAAKHPDQTTYFQPVLDVLDYCPGKLENVPKIVMVEGKNDFYTLKYFQEKIFNQDRELNLMPGNGAGNLDTLIRLYLAWGREFIVLLDSDGAGAREKGRYEKLFGPFVKGRINTLQDIDPSWTNVVMESLIEDSDRKLIQNIAYPSASEFNKTNFNRAIQELFLIYKRLSLSKTTLINFERIITFCFDRLNP